MAYVRRHGRSSPAFPDVVSAAMLAFLDTARTFDPTGRAAFRTVLFYRVRRDVTRTLNAARAPVRVPRVHVEIRNVLSQFERDHYQQHGRKPGFDELCSFLDYWINHPSGKRYGSWPRGGNVPALVADVLGVLGNAHVYGFDGRDREDDES